MDAQAAAQIFIEWAKIQGMLNSEQSINDREPHSVTSNFNEQAIPVLRSRQIQFVGFNEAKKEITVFTKKALPVSKKVLALLPTAIEDIDIKYRHGSSEVIGINPIEAHSSPPYNVRQLLNGGAFYTCGGSISVGNFRDSGTLGAIVMKADGSLYGLSNNHVTGSCNHSDSGLPIVAPGIYDVSAGGIDPFTIGHHTESLPMVPGSPSNIDIANNHDLAIFELKQPTQLSSYQGAVYDTPGSTLPLVAGMSVEKVGRTTGATIGTVISQVAGPIPISYSASLYDFSGKVFYEPAFIVVGAGDMFSDNGDSGSLVTHVDAAGTRHAVGIVVGGCVDTKAPGGKISIILPIHDALQKLGVTLVSGLNT